jgi:hypothetical protein
MKAALLAPLFTSIALLTAAGHAQALPTDVKVLARFDLGYAKCELRFAHMRGHRDDAYLALYRVRATPKARAELATARKDARYKRESELARRSMPQITAPDMEEKLAQQCEATWAETQRSTPPAQR